MTQSHRASKATRAVSVLAALTVLGLAASTAVAMSTGAIRPGDKPLSLTAADATCPPNTSTPHNFPLFPLPQAEASYKITLTPTTPAAGGGSATTKSIEIKVPPQLLQSDFNSLALALDAKQGATRWVDPTNLLELVTRMPTLLSNAQLPANIPVDRAAQQFADLIAEIFDAKGHDHTSAPSCPSPKVAGASNVWQVAILASDQASDLFERTDKPKPKVGDNPQQLKRNPYADKRAIDVLKVVGRVRDRAEAARQRMLLTPDTAAMQRAFERIDGIGYLFSNFREPQWGRDSVNSYAMSLRDFARTVDRHLTRLQGKMDETRAFKVTHKYKITTTTTANANEVKILEQLFNTPGTQFTGAFGILQEQQTSPVNQFANPAVNGGPVKTNKLDGCAIGNVEFTVYANGNKMIPVLYKGPKAFTKAEPVQQHVYRWTVPSADAASSAASRSLQKSIIESARSTKQLQWTLEAIATTEASANCPRVPVVPFVVNGVVPCAPPLKEVTNSPMANAKPAQTVDTKPAQMANAKPAQTVNTKPAQMANAKPAQTVDTKPAQMANAKPAQTVDTKPAQMANAKPAQTVDTKPAQMPNAKPAPTVDTKPAQMPNAKPAQTVDTKPAQMVNVKPAQIPNAKPAQTDSEKKASPTADAKENKAKGNDKDEKAKTTTTAAADKQTKEIKEKVSKCKTECSTGCRVRCEDMCEDRCEDRYGLKAPQGRRSCSSCASPCASHSESMSRACALANEPVTEEQQVTSSAQFSQQEEPASDTEFAFTDASSVDEDAFQGADEDGADEQDFSMEEDAADEADFSLDDLIDEDAADEADFAAEDAIDEDAADEVDFSGEAALDEDAADEADFAAEDFIDEDAADEADFSDEDALDEEALEEADFAAEDFIDEDAIEDEGAEEFALGEELADLLDEESLEGDA